MVKIMKKTKMHKRFSLTNPPTYAIIRAQENSDSVRVVAESLNIGKKWTHTATG